ncbi:ACP S-malonyltransferase [Streptomyces candidus]|uniref:[acyl-carrier-protein] S-malonyltransferase n=1 Tax=Streptomyces candidus TaxID=67283 RepID=A0A7X0HM17_9ACTN|nr:acyltransferase domain-containing protein [Streptomyces candidus]MBB6440036.1 [acyl-carrier-protein] S-malonyltransferase [Streptomyces candidus]
MLCPGQGAYRPGALTGIQHLPDVATVLATVDDVTPHTAHPVTRLLTDRDAPQPARLLALDPLAFDLATYAGTVACGNALRHHFHSSPQWVMGHSVGDIAAMAVAEAITAETGARLLHARHTLLRTMSPPTATAAGMLALALPVAEVVALLANLGLHHTRIAGDNAPQQTAVSGPLRELRVLHTLARAAGTRCTPLPSRTSYHHPLLTNLATVLDTWMETADVRLPTIPLYSSALARPAHTLQHIRELATQHLNRPVLFQASLHRLHRQGADAYIDSGPGALLSSLVRAVLPAAVAIAPIRGHTGPDAITRRLATTTLHPKP